MIYVFEGIEGAGKTTAARRYAESNGLKVFVDPSRHMPRVEGRTAAEWKLLGNQTNLHVASFAMIADFVVDRWALSSMVYDSMRGDCLPDKFYQEIAAETPAIVFVLDISPTTALERLREKHDPRNIDLQYLESAAVRYLHAADKWDRWGGDCRVYQGDPWKL